MARWSLAMFAFCQETSPLAGQRFEYQNAPSELGIFALYAPDFMVCLAAQLSWRSTRVKANGESWRQSHARTSYARQTYSTYAKRTYAKAAAASAMVSPTKGVLTTPAKRTDTQVVAAKGALDVPEPTSTTLAVATFSEKLDVPDSPAAWKKNAAKCN